MTAQAACYANSKGATYSRPEHASASRFLSPQTPASHRYVPSASEYDRPQPRARQILGVRGRRTVPFTSGRLPSGLLLPKPPLRRHRRLERRNPRPRQRKRLPRPRRCRPPCNRSLEPPPYPARRHTDASACVPRLTSEPTATATARGRPRRLRQSPQPTATPFNRRRRILRQRPVADGHVPTPAGERRASRVHPSLGPRRESDGQPGRHTAAHKNVVLVFYRGFW